MGFFKKEEKKELPELPELPPLPSIPEMQERPRSLPSFPSNSSGDRFSQSAIKTAIAPPPLEEEFDDLPMLAKTREIELRPSKFEPILPPITPMPSQIQSRPIIKPKVIEQPERMESVERVERPVQPFQSKSNQPIFIRIDKFEKAQENFEVIKSEVKQISGLLREIKEKRIKEEVELSEWEKEIEEIKNKISAIDSELFSKLG